MDEKKPNRFCDDPGAKLVPCTNCRYRIGIEVACEAYPEGIPVSVLRKVYEHPEKECAKGHKFEPRDE